MKTKILLSIVLVVFIFGCSAPPETKNSKSAKRKENIHKVENEDNKSNIIDKIKEEAKAVNKVKEKTYSKIVNLKKKIINNEEINEDFKGREEDIHKDKQNNSIEDEVNKNSAQCLNSDNCLEQTINILKNIHE